MEKKYKTIAQNKAVLLPFLKVIKNTHNIPKFISSYINVEHI